MRPKLLTTLIGWDKEQKDQLSAQEYQCYYPPAIRVEPLTRRREPCQPQRSERDQCTCCQGFNETSPHHQLPKPLSWLHK